MEEERGRNGWKRQRDRVGNVKWKPARTTEEDTY